MKNLIASLLIILLATSGVYAQEAEQQQKEQKEQKSEIRSLFSKSSAQGIYFGCGTGLSTIDGRDAFTFNSRLGWILGHNLAFGLTGTAFFTDMFYQNNNFNKRYNYTGAYGGFFFEPILLPKYPVHLSFPITVNMGGISYNSERNNYIGQNHEYQFNTIESDAFVLVEPAVELEVNMLSFVRMGVVTSYRYTRNFKMQGKSDNMLNGLTIGAGIKIGIF